MFYSSPVFVGLVVVISQTEVHNLAGCECPPLLKVEDDICEASCLRCWHLNNKKTRK